MDNEIAACAVCHALLHRGDLEVSGNPRNGLRWRARADRLKLSLEEERQELAYVPVLRHRMEAKGREATETESGRPDKVSGKVLGRGSERERMLLSALTKGLGFLRSRGKTAASDVLERVSDRAESMPEGELIKEAFRQ